MMDRLKDCADASPRKVLQGISEAVNHFAQEKEQFDDLTMLCLEYMPGRKER